MRNNEIQPAERDRRPEERQMVELIPALRAFARTFYRDRDRSDDLVQDTLARGLLKIHQFEPGTNLKSWLFTIMRNTFYNRIKAENRESTGEAACVSEPPAVNPTQEWSARGVEIAEAIERLPGQQREVVVLIGVIGMSYEEAAEICGCAIGTVKSRLNRARARLLAEMGEDTSGSSVQRDDAHPVISHHYN